MLTKLTVLLLILQLHKGSNSPLRFYYKRSTADLKTPGIALLVPINTQSPNVILTTRKKKGPNYPIPHHLLLPTQLHVIPAVSNIHHTTIHTDSGNPSLSHVTHSVTNITGPLILIPIHNHLVPVHDLSVIPLQRNRNVEKLGHYRAMEKKDEDEEVNRYRTYYGGYGTGLFFGGHGAGHGFYAYG